MTGTGLTEFAAVITGLITNLTPVLVSVLGAVLAVAAGVLVVRMGWRFLARFISR